MRERRRKIEFKIIPKLPPSANIITLTLACTYDTNFIHSTVAVMSRIAPFTGFSILVQTIVMGKNNAKFVLRICNAILIHSLHSSRLAHFSMKYARTTKTFNITMPQMK